MWMNSVFLEFNTPAVTWGQLSRASCEDLLPPTSLRHFLVYSVLSALTAPSSAASTPHSNCCEQTNSVFILNSPYPDKTWETCSSQLFHYKESKHSKYKDHIKKCPQASQDKMTYFSLNTSNLRLSLSFSSSLLCWGQKIKKNKDSARQKHHRNLLKTTAQTIRAIS